MEGISAVERFSINDACLHRSIGLFLLSPLLTTRQRILWTYFVPLVRGTRKRERGEDNHDIKRWNLIHEVLTRVYLAAIRQQKYRSHSDERSPDLFRCFFHDSTIGGYYLSRRCCRSKNHCSPNWESTILSLTSELPIEQLSRFIRRGEGGTLAISRIIARSRLVIRHERDIM